MDDRRDQRSEVFDESKVEEDFERLKKFMRLARTRRLEDVTAFIERVQVEILIGRPTRREKVLYRAIVDYFESIAEDRFDEEGKRPADAHSPVLAYVRRMLADWKPDDS